MTFTISALTVFVASSVSAHPIATEPLYHLRIDGARIESNARWGHSRAPNVIQQGKPSQELQEHQYSVPYQEPQHEGDGPTNEIPRPVRSGHEPLRRVPIDMRGPVCRRSQDEPTWEEVKDDREGHKGDNSGPRPDGEPQEYAEHAPLAEPDQQDDVHWQDDADEQDDVDWQDDAYEQDDTYEQDDADWQEEGHPVCDRGSDDVGDVAHDCGGDLECIHSHYM